MFGVAGISHGASGALTAKPTRPAADEKTIVENIITGSIHTPLRVVAFNTAEGWARDVTEDIAHAVFDQARSEQRPLGTAAQEFVERALDEDVAGDYAATASP